MSQAVRPDSVELGFALDIPIGVYAEISKANLGWQGQFNLAYTLEDRISAFARLGNSYWLGSPDYIHSGTQISFLGGLSFLQPLHNLGKLGLLYAGGAVGYGTLGHIVNWTLLDDPPRTNVFFDQMFLLQAEASLNLQDLPLDVFTRLGYLFSPEKNDLTKHQLGLYFGLKYRFSPRSSMVDQGSGSVGGELDEQPAQVVVIPVRRIDFDEAPPDLQVGETLVLVARVSPDDATDKGLEWTSSDATVAVVDANGMIQALAYGTVQIKAATTDGSVEAAKDLRVYLEPQGILDELSLDLPEGARLEALAQPLVLAGEAADGTALVWTSSDPEILAPDGTLIRPPFGSGDKGVTLTATIERGGQSFTKEFAVTVKEEEPSSQQIVQLDARAIEPDFAQGDSEAAVTGQVRFPSTGTLGSSVVWVIDPPDAFDEDGMPRRPVFGQGDTLTTVKAIISSGDVSVEKTYTLTIPELPQTVEAMVQADAASLRILFAEGDRMDQVRGNLSLPATAPGGSVVTWASSDPGTLGSDGRVRTPLDMDRQVVLTATVAKGDVTETKTFTVLVKDGSVAADTGTLEIGYSADDRAERVRGPLVLPQTGPNGTRIAWSTQPQGPVALDGTVTRTLGRDVTVSLTARVSKADLSAEKTFSVVVRDSSVVADAASIELGFAPGESTEALSTRLTLPATGPNGTTIAWQSGNTAVLSHDGVADRTPGQDRQVQLVATVSKADLSQKREFVLVVKDASVEVDAAGLVPGFAPGDSLESVSANLSLPASGPNGTTISWQSSDPALVSQDGQVDRSATVDRPVQLAATVTKADQSRTVSFDLTVRDASVELDAREITIGYAERNNAEYVTRNLVLPRSGANGTTINWSSSPSLVAADGSITRPEGRDQRVTLAATVAKADRELTREFSVQLMDNTWAVIASSVARAIRDNNLTEVTVDETDRGLNITATGLRFEPDKANVTADIARQLDILGTILAGLDLRRARVLFEGHSTPVGTVASQVEVSRDRAQAVASYLVGKGIVEESRIVVEGIGGARPLDPANPTAANNRRVEIVIMPIE
jgi:outer membrane protein OmpA-like peptidoglycan-associated protein